jgi:hypothetical protein
LEPPKNLWENVMEFSHGIITIILIYCRKKKKGKIILQGFDAFVRRGWIPFNDLAKYRGRGLYDGNDHLVSS